LLGYNYLLSGTVTKGNQLGRKLGYPTANILPADRYKLIPADGIYAVKVILPEDITTEKNEKHNSVMSIGMRPTVNGTHCTIEAYIFDFTGDLYEKKITVEFIERIREERKFETLDLMVEEIKRDEMKARNILSEK
jgi:riboflavin kinase/FMN adenylyltransferase